MAQLWRRHTNELGVVRNPGLRLLPAMLVGLGTAAALAYFAVGLHPDKKMAEPDVEIRASGTSLHLPDGTVCTIERHGCDLSLAQLPPGRVRVIARPEVLFAVAAPALAVAARHGAEALLDDGTGPVAVHPRFPAQMKEWADINPDAPGFRLRVVLRADGIWIGTVDGKVLGSDPRGPSLLPTATGQDYAGLSRKLASVRRTLKDTEDTCALLPALDTPVGEVVRAATAIHKHFGTVLLAVQ